MDLFSSTTFYQTLAKWDNTESKPTKGWQNMTKDNWYFIKFKISIKCNTS